MFWFSKKKALQGEKLLNGITDIHCHLLPGVDDGFSLLSDSFELLTIEEELGVKRVYFTPHSMGREGAVVDPESYGQHKCAPVIKNNPYNEPAGGFSNVHLQAEFNEYKKQYKGGIDVRLAAEYMINREFFDKVKAKDILTYSDGKHVLVETSYYFPPLEFDKILYTLSLEGYSPIIAHPERYRYMDRDQYKQLKDKGYEFQLNYLSLTKYYGETPYRKALDLLDRGWYNYAGSDFHRLSTLGHTIHRLKPDFKRTNKLLELFANNDAL